MDKRGGGVKDTSWISIINNYIDGGIFFFLIEREDWRRDRFGGGGGDEDLIVWAILSLRFLRDVSVEMPCQ